MGIAGIRRRFRYNGKGGEPGSGRLPAADEMQERIRCAWCEDNGIVLRYHDEEWGVPLHDDRKQFEYLMMEVMQCGLNWTMMLKKREIFRVCFDDFDYEKIAEYGEAEIGKIMDTPGMIRSRRKIEAVIGNAGRFMKIQDEYGSFARYLWGYTEGRPIRYEGHGQGALPAKNGLSDRISRDLKKRGFRYLGSITVYAHLQACGIINDHTDHCFRYHQIIRDFPVCHREREEEG